MDNRLSGSPTKGCYNPTLASNPPKMYIDIDYHYH